MGVCGRKVLPVWAALAVEHGPVALALDLEGRENRDLISVNYTRNHSPSI